MHRTDAPESLVVNNPRPRRSLSLLLLPAVLPACEAAYSVDSGLGPSGAALEEKAYIDATAIWTNTRIPVCWENPGDVDPTKLLAVQDLANETWAKHSRVKFIGWGTCIPTSPGIRIFWDDVQPSSHIGTDLEGNIHGMTLNPDYDHWPVDDDGIFVDTNCNDSLADEISCIRKNAIHEFGHALGFVHEHSRPDTPESCEYEDGSSGTDMIGAWDEDSVMSYCSGNRTWLTDTDIDAVQRYYGAPLLHPDFDNDAYHDLVIGVPGEDLGGESNHGAVSVLYGTSAGLTEVWDHLWFQDAAYVEGDGEAGDDLGKALAAGDFDWDGYSDLAIGVPGEAVGSVGNAGAVNVLYGFSTGLGTFDDQIWDQNSSGVPDTADVEDGFGTALAVGDFNRDHYMDLAIGTPLEDILGKVSMGAVTILYGSASGLTGTGSAMFHQDTTDVEGTGEAFDEFGAALAAGDVDGDGYDDLVIGVPGEAVGSASAAGAINVLYGSATGLSAAGDEIWNQGGASIGDTATAGDRFGAALAVADFDDDGIFDVAVGVPGESDAVSNGGGVHILYGSTAGLDASNDVFFEQSDIVISGSPGVDDAMGASLAVGYLNNDLFADLVVGIPGAGVGTASAAGEVMVFFGSGGGLSTSGEQIWNQDTTGIQGVAASGEEFGAAVTSADYDGDGVWDFAAGVANESVAAYASAGTVSVIYGSATGPDAEFNQVWSQASTDVEDDAESGDSFGRALR